MTKKELKAEAIDLRQQGFSYNEIRERLSEPVAKSTLSGWLRDVEFDDEKKRALQRRWRKKLSDANRGTRGRPGIAEFNKLRYREKRQRLLDNSRCSVKDLEFSPDTLAFVGAALYWAEGSKGHGAFSFANSDVVLARLYLRWMREFIGIEDEEIICRINVYLNNGLSYRDVENHWIDELGLSAKNFRKPTIPTPRPGYGKNKGKLPYGVVAITAKNPQKYRALYFALIERLGADAETFVSGA